MLSPGRLLRRLRYALDRRSLEAELDDELRFHLEMEAAKQQRAGLDPAEAHRTALLRFGDVERVKDECREARGLTLLDDLRRDLRFSVRTLARRPMLTAVSVLTLALGIGGTTAIFGAVYGILLAPLPYRDPERIVAVWEHDRRAGDPRSDVAPANFLDWRERSRAFARLAAAEPFSLDYEGPDGPVRFRNARVSEGFFEILGTRPLLGRTFGPEEFIAGRDRVVVFSHELWQRHFHGDSGVVGRTLVLDSLPRMVIGVMPRGFETSRGDEVWSPKVFTEDERQQRSAAFFTVIGLLRPGTSLSAAQAEMAEIGAALSREHPRTNGHVGVTLVPLPEQLLGHARGALLVLFGAVVCVLLIACANVANLQLAAAARRQRELAIRVALGAGRARLVRQLLTESLLLALVGGGAGLALAYLGLEAIRSFAPDGLPRLDELGLRAPVLAFALALTIFTALLFGLAPVLRAARVDFQQGLAADSRSGSAGVRRRFGSALVVAEVALALVLLVGAGLLVKSFTSLLGVDRGFRTNGVVAVTMQAWGYYPTPVARAAFVREAATRLAAIPGVKSAGMTSSLPLSAPIGAHRAGLEIDGAVRPSSQEPPTVHVAATTSGYFSALHIPVRRGRMFEPADDAGPPVALVNETLARSHWPGGSAIGKRITFRFMGPPRSREIVGVVGDVRHGGLHEDPRPVVFVPHAQAPTGAVHLVVDAGRAAPSLLPAIRRELHAMNHAMPLTDMATLDSLLDRSLSERRFYLALLGTFALVAALLAAVGIYGVISGVTAERTHEIGIRIALGAQARHVLGMVMRHGMTLAIGGVALGALGAALLTGLLRDMLYHVGPLDPVAFVVGMAVLLTIAAVACWVPAARAARLDPVRAIRAD